MQRDFPGCMQNIKDLLFVLAGMHHLECKDLLIFRIFGKLLCLPTFTFLKMWKKTQSPHYDGSVAMSGAMSLGALVLTLVRTSKKSVVICSPQRKALSNQETKYCRQAQSIWFVHKNPRIGFIKGIWHLVTIIII